MTSTASSSKTTPTVPAPSRTVLASSEPATAFRSSVRGPVTLPPPYWRNKTCRSPTHSLTLSMSRGS